MPGWFSGPGADVIGDDYVEVAGDVMTGPLTFSGDGRRLIAIWIGAEGVRAPGIKPATWVDHGITGAWEFTDGTDDTIVANMRIPNRMDRSVAPTFYLGWSAPVADPGDNSKRAIWQVEYLWTALDESTIAAAQATLSITTTASAVLNGLAMSAVTLQAPAAADQCLHLRIKRLGAIDSLGVVANLLGICMSCVSDKLGSPLP